MVVINLEEQQQKLGHKIYILTPNCTEIVDKSNVMKFGLKDKAANWDVLSLKRIFSLLILLVLSFSLIKKIKPNIVHSHSADLGFIFSFACRINKIPIINQCHGVSFPYKHASLMKRMIEVLCLKYSKFNKIITVDLSSLSSFHRINIKNVEFINNGVDCERFNTRKKKKESDKTVFLFVGRLEKQKGLNYLIEAINILLRKHTEFIVKLVGAGSEETNLKELVEKFQLTKHIKFLGSKNSQEIVSYYKNSDVFILPSVWEGFPITLLEAWSANLPVIITDVGMVSEICQDKENALIVPPRKTDRIAEAMHLLIENKQLREKLGKNGKKLVEEKYSWTKISKEYELIYKKLVVI